MRHSHTLLHVHTQFDQNPISGLGATFGDGRTDRQTDGRTDGRTDGHVTKPRSRSQSVPSLELGTQKAGPNALCRQIPWSDVSEN